MESTLRFVTSAAFLAMGGVSYVFGAKEAAGEWVDTSRDVMGGSDIEEWRQKNRETFTATPRDEAAVSWAYMAGSMVPSLLLTAATGGLAASSVVSIANTWQEGTRQALKNGADYGTALLYGGAVGAMDATVSALTGGFGGKFKVGKKVVEFGTDALAKKAAGFLCKSEAGKYWVKLGLTALMEQPLSLMAMTAAPLLQRSMYDPDAELYTAEQITSAAVQGFLTRGLLEIAKDVPVFLKSIGGGKSLVDADADLPANLKRKIDGKLEDALKKAELGKAPEVEADPEQALRQMRQNTQAELGGKLELDIPDAGKNLATVLAADAELRGGGIRGAGEARLGLGETKPIDPESTYKVSVADDLPLKDVLARELGGIRQKL